MSQAKYRVVGWVQRSGEGHSGERGGHGDTRVDISTMQENRENLGAERRAFSLFLEWSVGT